jgi:hypothetical protein
LPEGHNGLCADFVKRPEDWRWSSLDRALSGATAEEELLSAGPVRHTADWVEHLNLPQTEAELRAIYRNLFILCSDTFSGFPFVLSMPSTQRKSNNPPACLSVFSSGPLRTTVKFRMAHSDRPMSIQATK